MTRTTPLPIANTHRDDGFCGDCGSGLYDTKAEASLSFEPFATNHSFNGGSIASETRIDNRGTRTRQLCSDGQSIIGAS